MVVRSRFVLEEVGKVYKTQSNAGEVSALRSLATRPTAHDYRGQELR